MVLNMSAVSSPLTAAISFTSHLLREQLAYLLPQWPWCPSDVRLVYQPHPSFDTVHKTCVADISSLLSHQMAGIISTVKLEQRFGILG